jgi:hypothetical protein
VRLRELDPSFIRREIRSCSGGPDCSTVSPHTEHEYWINVASIAEADGLMFLCPVCFVTNKGPVGTHGVLCWRPRVPQNVAPKPGRWEFEGTSLDDISLVAASSSIFLTGEGCGAHFYIRSGEIQ